MEVHLTPDHEAFIQSNVRNGRFSSADNAMREAVDLLASHERETTATRAFLQPGLDDLEAGNFEEFTDENLHMLFDGIRNRSRERLRSPATISLT